MSSLSIVDRFYGQELTPASLTLVRHTPPNQLRELARRLDEANTEWVSYEDDSDSTFRVNRYRLPVPYPEKVTVADRLYGTATTKPLVDSDTLRLMIFYSAHSVVADPLLTWAARSFRTSTRDMYDGMTDQDAASLTRILRGLLPLRQLLEDHTIVLAPEPTLLADVSFSPFPLCDKFPELCRWLLLHMPHDVQEWEWAYLELADSEGRLFDESIGEAFERAFGESILMDDRAIFVQEVASCLPPEFVTRYGLTGEPRDAVEAMIDAAYLDDSCWNLGAHRQGRGLEPAFALTPLATDSTTERLLRSMNRRRAIAEDGVPPAFVDAVRFSVPGPTTLPMSDLIALKRSAVEFKELRDALSEVLDFGESSPGEGYEAFTGEVSERAMDLLKPKIARIESELRRSRALASTLGGIASLSVSTFLTAIPGPLLDRLAGKASEALHSRFTSTENAREILLRTFLSLSNEGQ